MPLAAHKKNGGFELLIWDISESVEELCAFVTDEDRKSASAFASARRRSEHLAWRAALRTRIPHGKVGYSQVGAPYVEGAESHIGAAHTSGLAVVIVSESPCAVDVERTDRVYAKVAAKFISASESQLADAALPEFPAAVWCAKEAMYKYSGRRELDFLRDLKVTSCDLAAGTLTGEITGQTVQAGIERFGKYLIVYIVA